MGEEFEVGEQYLNHARAVDEVGDVGFVDGAPNGLELPADRQILKAEAEPDCFHAVAFDRYDAGPGVPRLHSSAISEDSSQSANIASESSSRAGGCGGIGRSGTVRLKRGAGAGCTIPSIST